jgi:aldehyde dehydrogenase (NAD+)
VGRTGPERRKEKIGRLRRAVLDRRAEIREAMRADLDRPAVETDLTEVKAVADEAAFAIKHLEAWMEPDRVSTPPLLFGTRSEIRYQPKGVVLIMTPWNFPFNLTLGPLVAAIAAGNCAVVKPSEYSPYCSGLLRDMIADLFDPREVAVVEGDADTAQALLEQPFDHVHFTGSPRVGRIVMRAAADHLASVTLELGGKSPTLVDATADVEDAAAKIAWGKFLNAGQTCIAPDYVLADERVHDDLVDALRDRIARLYGATAEARRASDDYGRLVSDRHYDRVTGLLDDALSDGARLAAGGDTDAGARYVAPTLLTDVPLDTPAMQEEIFGPLLPIVSTRTLDEALSIIRERPNPLSLYVFSTDDAATERVLEETRAGGSCVNDVLLHYMNPHLPFGGAGESGIGASHGRHAFREFSNDRAVLRRSYGSKLLERLHPPYGPLARTLTDWLLRL